MIYRCIERTIASLLFFALLPVVGILYVLVKLDSKGPFVFKQKRAGKNKKPFTIYKIRTMVVGAERQQKGLMKQNEADGPVFKIRSDPRFTRIGKFLSHCAADEVLQLVNIIKGDMALIGPRPLPVAEAQKVPKQYDLRFSVLPGMTSSWIAKGAHSLSFSAWMKLDVDYVKNRSVKTDIWIMWKTLLTIIKQILYTST